MKKEENIDEIIQKRFAEFGKAGGKKVLKKYGKEHFKKLRAMRGKKLSTDNNSTPSLTGK